MAGYLQALRKILGSRKLIHPGARILIENAQGDLLFIRRRDNARWGLVAGGMEEGESLRECIIREVKEETGLKVLEVELIGLSSMPEKETVTYPNGDVVQYVTAVFYCHHWQGDLQTQTDESIDARFFPLDKLPELPENERPSLDWLRRYKQTGKVHLE